MLKLRNLGWLEVATLKCHLRAVVQVDDPLVIEKISTAIKKQLSKKPVKFLCIGTDRSTGDSFGPLIGSKLAELGYNVSGTIDDPVHAGNLETTLKKNSYFKDFFLIAVDASLGKPSSVGKLSVIEGSIEPGSGVCKELPSVGDISITGVVNVGGFMEFMVLQNTRLSLVFKMANKVTEAIKNSVSTSRLHEQEG